MTIKLTEASTLSRRRVLTRRLRSLLARMARYEPAYPDGWTVVMGHDLNEPTALNKDWN